MKDAAYIILQHLLASTITDHVGDHVIDGVEHPVINLLERNTDVPPGVLLGDSPRDLRHFLSFRIVRHYRFHSFNKSITVERNEISGPLVGNDTPRCGSRSNDGETGS